mgnify:CR=1 FL=1
MTTYTEIDESDRHRQEAVAEVARLLRGRLLPGMDPDLIAGHAVDAMHGLGWRHVPRSDRIPDQGRRDPQVAHRGAALVRAALDEVLTEGDTTDG